MLSLYEVGLTLLMLVCALWTRYRLSGLEASFSLKVGEETQRIDGLMSSKIQEALNEFEDFAEEVVPQNPDPFEAMEIMRANMINQVLGLGVEWVAKKFTSVDMGVHQLENVHKPPDAGEEAWQDVDAEQPSEEPAEIQGTT